MMKKIFLFIILLTSLTFGQDELITVFDDEANYTPPTGYEFFMTSDGDTLKTSEGEYFLVKTSILYQLKNILDSETIYADNRKRNLKIRKEPI